MKNKTTTGYTLIEVIIALAIFAVLGAMSVGLLSRAFDTKARLKAQLDPLAALELATARITYDTAQVVNHAAGKKPAFIGEATSVTFSRGGFVSPDNTQSTLRRITLSCKDAKLTRKTGSILDDTHTDADSTEEQVLLESLDDCSFSYLFPEDDTEKKTTFPRAIKLHLSLHKLGDIMLMFPISGGQT
jgi:general secretion pathway protein J